jgi:hypothetical protein
MFKKLILMNSDPQLLTRARDSPSPYLSLSLLRENLALRRRSTGAENAIYIIETVEHADETAPTL